MVTKVLEVTYIDWPDKTTFQVKLWGISVYSESYPASIAKDPLKVEAATRDIQERFAKKLRQSLQETVNV